MLAATEVKKKNFQHTRKHSRSVTGQLCCLSNSLAQATLYLPAVHQRMKAPNQCSPGRLNQFIQETDHVLLNLSSEMVLVREDMIYSNPSDIEMCEPCTGSESYTSCWQV